MTGYLDHDAVEVRYLLGELPEQEEKRFEQRYFADNQAFEDLQIAEGEVIDAYVSERLSAEARLHLEKRFSKSPRLRERVKFARTFARNIPDIHLDDLPVAPVAHPAPTPVNRFPNRWLDRFFQRSSGRQSALNWALAGGVAVVLLGGAAVVVQSVRLRREGERLTNERAAIERQREELRRLSAEQNAKLDQLVSELKTQQINAADAQARVEQLQQRLEQIESKRENASTPAMATVILLPGVRNVDGPKEVKIPPGITQLPLGLVLETADYSTYSVVINDEQQTEISKKSGLRLRGGKTIFLKVPATKLKPGTYDVDVSGVNASGATHLRSYQFRVVGN